MEQRHTHHTQRRDRRRTPGAVSESAPDCTARYADEFTLPLTGPEQRAQLYAGAQAARARIPDRPPLPLSLGLGTACGRSEDEISVRLAARYEQSRLPPEEPHGSPAGIVEQLGAYAELDTNRIYVRLRALSDLDH
ncbi:hypothetical protein [Streptomyces sp. DSM 40750]|uniref:hypothetical protein n=1 Tax=Streptomyces sp. DSM 40750 TaxID=2801030 RepID=UPI00214B785F|nr:hypothetical protein [Streptomyces sp. DSM 40750]UUU25279.1 hypothetical protein JIX55_36300 [Streptomyces sp. DSM 40750]